MEKKEAKEILEAFYTKRIQQRLDLGLEPKLSLPIVDEIVYSPTPFQSYTFKGLIKIIYDLK